MRPRFLLVVSAGGDVPGLAAALAARTGLQLSVSTPQAAVLVNQECGCWNIDDRLLVLGTVFRRYGPARVIVTLDAVEHDALAAGRGDLLLRSYWGGYVAVEIGEGIVQVLRDPSGALPCYRASLGGASLFASDVDLLLACGAAIGGIDWNALGRLLLRGGLPVRETVLEGVSLLLPGMAVASTNGSEQEVQRWSPWDHVEGGDDAPAEELAERLRRVVQQCVGGWASCHARPVVSVSGGLDSSIVAAVLAHAGVDARCLTLFTDDPAGDEREYAHQLCTRLDLPLTECRFDLSDVDITAALGAHLPVPSGRAQAQAFERAHIALAEREGADAFFSGNGGDNVFGYSQSAAALADRLLRQGIGGGAFATLRDICRQTGAGPVRVARAALRLCLRSPGYRWKPSPILLLDPGLVAGLGGVRFDHPWLAAPAGALPGKAAHIAGLVRAQPNIEPGRSRTAPVVNPLLSQPVMETCLAIPSWRWREGGRDRAVARRAFAGDLPRSLLDRRVKGTPDPFCGEIIHHNRDAIRERLLNGHLARQSMLDCAAIERVLRPDRATTGEEHVRLLDLINIEAWLDQMLARLAVHAGALETERPYQ